MLGPPRTKLERPLPRKLAEPRMHYVPELSLPRVMADFMEGISISDRDRSAGARAREVGGLSAQVAAATAAFGGDALAEAAAREWKLAGPPEPPARDLLKGKVYRQGALLSARYPPRDADGKRPCSRELHRRQQLHPRLRWARLALGDPMLGASSPASPATSMMAASGQASLPESVATCEDGAEASIAASVSPSLHERPSTAETGNAESSCWTATLRPGSSLSGRGAPTPRPAILPRSRPAPRVPPGVASTLHAPCIQDEAFASEQGSGCGEEEEEDEEDESRSSASGTSSRTSMSEAEEPDRSPSATLAAKLGREASKGEAAEVLQSVDRKWFMRMSPISCLPSEYSSKAARRDVAELSVSSDAVSNPASAAAALAAQARMKPGIRKQFSSELTPNAPSRASRTSVLVPGGNASRGGSSVRADVVGEAGEYLNFERWGVDDEYLDALLSSHSRHSSCGLDGVRHVNLSGNQLTDAALGSLTQHGSPACLRTINLAANRLNPHCAQTSLSALSQCYRLRELSLSENRLGDAVVERLCEVLMRTCKELEGLGLAQCEIGASATGGLALGYFVSLARSLVSLDLNWNMLQGEGAYALLKGVYENNVDVGGRLSQLSLAWNPLGGGEHADARRRKEASACARMLGDIFSDSKVLFHLDLSYNGFSASDCGVLGEGLAANHTLFGLHLNGNDATMDDFGFVKPCVSKAVIGASGSRFKGNAAASEALRPLANLSVPESAAAAAATAATAVATARSAVASAEHSPNPDAKAAALSAQGAAAAAATAAAALAIEGSKEILARVDYAQQDFNRYLRNVPARFRLDHPADFSAAQCASVGQRSASRQGARDAGASAEQPGSSMERTPRYNPALSGLVEQHAVTPVFSEDDMRAERRWLEERSRVLPICGGSGSGAEAVQRNVQCCWICENWVAHSIMYFPSAELLKRIEEDDISSVYVVFSIDGFSRPTLLQRKENVLDAEFQGDDEGADAVSTLGPPSVGASRLGSRTPSPVASPLASKRSSAASARGAGPTAPKAKGQPAAASSRRGSASQQNASSSQRREGPTPAQWVGMRMLPPSREHIQIVFIVNGCADITKDLPRKKLRQPTVISLAHGHGSGNGGGPQTLSVSKVNVIQPDHEPSEASPTPSADGSTTRRSSIAVSASRPRLCVVADPRSRAGGMVVLPRSCTGDAAVPTF
eukprot:TRINITY_DN18885_c0_g1_i1.p1 TRINITY_DN18885_c0_g1~~TRINITY_DN18885_c0_g1_i1.p1  ORF type:complete len:1190 (+),score=260.08 TRINITY_DN18885_c0_g1_i1:212-3781(+)